MNDNMLCWWTGEKFNIRQARFMTDRELLKGRGAIGECLSDTHSEDARAMYRHEIDLYNEEIEERAEAKRAHIADHNARVMMERKVRQASHDSLITTILDIASRQ